jgi:hypothetical protein
MSDPLVVQTLSEKRAEILGRIAAYEALIAQAKHDLAHVNATIRLFTEPEKQRARYMVSHGFFKKGEIAEFCAASRGVWRDDDAGTRRAGDGRARPGRGGYGAAQLGRLTGRPGPASRQAAAARADAREAQGDVRLGTWRRSHAARRRQYPFHFRLTGSASA